jgi:hypothetical protein
MIIGFAALIARLFTPTVDRAMADFERIRRNLVRVRQHHAGLALAKREFASKMIGEATEHQNEAMRAARAEASITNLID